MTPVCPYHQRPAVLSSLTLWRPVKREARIWACPDPTCDARVGVHSNSRVYKPLGSLANGATRAARHACHLLFDPLWSDAHSHFVNRRSAYAWLAGELGIPVERCHFGEFDEAMCARAEVAILSLLEPPL